MQVYIGNDKYFHINVTKNCYTFHSGQCLFTAELRHNHIDFIFETYKYNTSFITLEDDK